jgi:troponin I
MKIQVTTDFSFFFLKQDDKAKRKAEVRARLEQAAAAKKGRKGFMTPARKKKLRVRILIILS